MPQETNPSDTNSRGSYASWQPTREKTISAAGAGRPIWLPRRGGLPTIRERAARGACFYQQSNVADFSGSGIDDAQQPAAAACTARCSSSWQGGGWA